ncbi:hypothetical protein [Paenibacillus sp. NPDC058177]|uniref:hypothetical protein n=1 Tax=Paenibacillus sp. NPDC058177 TaxID=3346369 RepID=UPI0036DCD4B3
MSKIKPEDSGDNKEQGSAAGDNLNENGASTPAVTETTVPSVDGAKAAEKIVDLPPKESVALKGWEEGREGAHTIHLKEGIFTFIDGQAELSSEAAEALRQAGFVE